MPLLEAVRDEPFGSEMDRAMARVDVMGVVESDDSLIASISEPRKEALQFSRWVRQGTCPYSTSAAGKVFFTSFTWSTPPCARLHDRQAT